MKKLMVFLALLAPAAAQDGAAMTVEDVMAVIDTIDGGEGESRTVTIDRGTADGLVPGSSGTLWAVWSDKRDSGAIGRAVLLKATSHYGTVRVTMTKPEGNGLVRVGDVVEFKARVPRLPNRSILWKIARLHIDLHGPLDKQPFIPYRLLYANETRKLSRTLLDLMVAQIRDTGEKFGEMDALKKRYEQGRYRGKTAHEVMTGVGREDIQDFLAFVAEYPGKYYGRSWRIDEVFATWVINAAPSGVQPTTTIARTTAQLEETLVEKQAADAEFAKGLRIDVTDVPELPEKTTALVYYAGNRFLHIWVYGPGGFKAWLQRDLTRADLAAHVDKLRALLTGVKDGADFGPAAEADEKNPAAYRKNAAETRKVLTLLHGHLVAPVAGHIGADDTLLVMSTDLLNLPFAALVDGENRFLGTRHTIAYFRNPAAIRRTLAKPPAKRDRDYLVAIADPRGALAATLAEAAEIRQPFAEAVVHTEQTGTATLEQLMKLPAECTVLHVATRGIRGGERPSDTYLELDQGNLDIRGVNRLRAAPGFRNRSVRLVVLSAEAGWRMAQTFRFIGAPSVVFGLAPPRDYATTDFMAEFYRRLVKDKQPIGVALQGARQAVRSAGTADMPIGALGAVRAHG